MQHTRRQETEDKEKNYYTEQEKARLHIRKVRYC